MRCAMCSVLSASAPARSVACRPLLHLPHLPPATIGRKTRKSSQELILSWRSARRATTHSRPARRATSYHLAHFGSTCNMCNTCGTCNTCGRHMAQLALTLATLATLARLCHTCLRGRATAAGRGRHKMGTRGEWANLGPAGARARGGALRPRHHRHHR
jgi:hypothetical protein